MGRRISKGIGVDQLKSEDSAREERSPTYLNDAASLNGGACQHGGYASAPMAPDANWQQRWKQHDRLRRHGVDQGHATYDKAAGDFEQL